MISWIYTRFVLGYAKVTSDGTLCDVSRSMVGKLLCIKYGHYTC